MRLKSIFLEVIYFLLIVLFLYAGIGKLLDHQGFVHGLKNQPIAEHYIPFLSWGLPVAEITIALSICSKKSRLVALYISMVLLLIFTLYNILILWGYISVNEYTADSYTTWRERLNINLFFMLITVVAIRLNITYTAIGRSEQFRPE